MAINHMIRVSISGAPCTGKTTLFHSLIELFGDAIASSIDLPRQTLEKLGGIESEISNEELQNYLGIGQLLAETGKQKYPFISLHDKSLIDALAYWRVLVGKEDPSWAKVLTKSRYSLVIISSYNEIQFNNKDTLRFPHIHLRAIIDQEVRRIVRNLGCNHLELTGGKTERLNRSKNALECLIKAPND